MASVPVRQISRLLIANRGEIAARIINGAREHDPPIDVFALATLSDTSHTLSLPSSRILNLNNASDYLNISLITSLVQKHSIDAVHPGYGFLSESAEFARRMWEEVGAVVIGPSWRILEKTGDKLAARLLAVQCDVPVLPAMRDPTGSVEDAQEFAHHAGFPVMVKAVDGGGGRGIRLVRDARDLKSNFKRAVQESPSQQVFVEKAAVDGFHHIEVQIVGDGTGEVTHLWERECSIQRRYQKIVEIAPSSIRGSSNGDQLVNHIIAAALRMAGKLKYLSLGTFEFLASSGSCEFFFLEINPRIQVEHTITEQISEVDLVALQLEIAQGVTIAKGDSDVMKQVRALSTEEWRLTSPTLHSIQLRLTAENPHQSFALSIGKIRDFSFPNGNGVRIDTSLAGGHEFSVSPEFDSLMAKIIVTGCSWKAAFFKARRALEDTRVDGVETNLGILRAIVASNEFMSGKCDTQWLENNLTSLLSADHALSQGLSNRILTGPRTKPSSTTMTGSSNSAVLLRKGDAWNIDLTSGVDTAAKSERHVIKLNRILRNEFPSFLNTQISYSVPGVKEPQTYQVSARAASRAISGAGVDSSTRHGDPSNPGHIMVPFPGVLIEVLVDEGDQVQPGQVICIIKQMKMELEVRAKEQQEGVVKWVTDIEDGVEVAEGTLVVELYSAEDTVLAKL